MINHNTHVREFIDYIHDGTTVADLIDQLRRCVINNQHYEDLRFEIENDWGDVTYGIYGVRRKTEEELRAAAENEARMKERRRQQYESLKKEFGE